LIQVRFSEPIPRKGTETLLRRYGEKSSGDNGFSEPIPRKGTETSDNPTVPLSLTLPSFFRTYSPQGDGNLAGTALSVDASTKVFQNLFPARGRKLRRYSMNLAISMLLIAFFRTYSPQGDGNYFFFLGNQCAVIARFSEPIPRKGTETIMESYPKHQTH